MPEGAGKAGVDDVFVVHEGLSGGYAGQAMELIRSWVDQSIGGNMIVAKSADGLNLALIIGHEHLLLPKLGRLKKMSRE